MAEPKFYGKYRATVVDTDDPEKRGRIRVNCPTITGEQGTTDWCNPCTSFATDNCGDICLPKTGDSVWIEFEEGDKKRPIHTGNWWGDGKTPLSSYDMREGERITSYENVKITFTKDHYVIELEDSKIDITDKKIEIETVDKIIVKVKDSKIEMTEDKINIETENLDIDVNELNINVGGNMSVKAGTINMEASDIILKGHKCCEC